MRPVVLYTLLSLDGVAESPDGWLFDFDEVMDANLGAVIGEQDAVLLGRQMYDEWSQYWPDSDVQPFADFINPVRKYVFTSTAPTRAWTNTVVINGDVAETVIGLKQSDGGAIGVHGSIRLAQSLLRAGLVDELRLVIAPTTAGHGRRLFEDNDLQRWRLADVTGTPSGAVLLSYHRSQLRSRL